MVCVNALKDLKCSKRLILNELVIMVAPFAPFVCEELWEVLGNTPSVLNAQFPIFNEEYLKQDEIQYPVSINGKTRGQVVFPSSASKEEIEKLVPNLDVVMKWTIAEGKDIKKVIVVPGRMINVVI
jgi:leucyl-tRNA synthetase